MNKKILTILCISYNHENFIKQALESFVAQKTNFSFEVLVSDDASTDNTAKIIEEFAKQYPEIIKPILRQQNVGFWENFIGIAEMVETKYVSLCEGDDYWIDENKLQKQVDFLEKNPDFSICFHPVNILSDKENKIIKSFPSKKMIFNKNELNLKDLLIRNFIQTNSVIYRWRFGKNEKIRDIFPKNILPMDYFFHLLHAQNGKIYFLDDNMAVYRIHQGGIWNGANQTDEWFLKYGIQHLNFYDEIEKNFKFSCYNKKLEISKSITLAFLKSSKFEELGDFSKSRFNLYLEVINSFKEKSKYLEEVKFKKRIKKLKKAIILFNFFYALIIVLIIIN